VPLDPDFPSNLSRLDAHGFKAKKEQRQAINRWNNFVLGQEYVRKAARLCPRSREYVSALSDDWAGWLMCRREKKAQRNRFDLQLSVHKSEYCNIKRPIDPSTNTPLEPAHKFEVNLEPDRYSKEKSASHLLLRKCTLTEVGGIFSFAIKHGSIRSHLRGGSNRASNTFSALA
jgi:hypothetical protein